MIYYGIGHPTGFPWIAALITGALLAATDPVAVLEVMRRLGVPERLCILLDGEALFNDATAIVTFSIFLYIAQHPLENITVTDASLRFLIVFFGGAIAGLFIGFRLLISISVATRLYSTSDSDINCCLCFLSYSRANFTCLRGDVGISCWDGAG